MKILLYNPDNGVTQNFMPHLWMFLLQALTPPPHEVVLIDGNARPMSDAELVRFVASEGIGLVGIGAITRMIAKAEFLGPVLRRFAVPWETFHIIPVESGRGCPYGCEFCTVTGFFGDSTRFRTMYGAGRRASRYSCQERTSSHWARPVAGAKQNAAVIRKVTTLP